MKTTLRLRLKLGLGFVLLAALALVLIPAAARAEDYNLDGFDDLVSAISTPDSPQIPVTLSTTQKNLFFILWPQWEDPSFPTYLWLCPPTCPQADVPGNPAVPLAFAGDLGLNLIPLARPSTSNITNRYVNGVSGQNADRIKEYNKTPLSAGSNLGDTQVGTPNFLDDAKIFTYKIKELIEKNCAGSPRIEIIDPSTSTSTVQWCASLVGQQEGCWPLATQTDIKNAYAYIRDFHTKNTVAHELAHEVNLVSPPSSKLGPHYATGTGVILDAATQCKITYARDKVTKTLVTWYIATKYAAGDRTALKLK
jgi:hypothetical protein